MNPIVFFAVSLLLLPAAPAQSTAIRDETAVPSYSLPEVLRDAQSRPIATAGAWQDHRPELLKQFGEQMYGVTPPLLHPPTG